MPHRIALDTVVALGLMVVSRGLGPSAIKWTGALHLRPPLLPRPAQMRGCTQSTTRSAKFSGVSDGCLQAATSVMTSSLISFESDSV